MAFITLEDTVGSVETVVFSKVFDEAASLLLDDTGPVLIVKARVDRGSGEEDVAVKLIADEISALHEVEARATKRVDIHLEARSVQTHELEALRQTLEKHRGQIPGYLHLKVTDGDDEAKTVLRLPPGLRLEPTPQLKEEVAALIGRKVVQFNA